MELNINERIALLLALQNRRSHLIKTVRNKIDYLKSIKKISDSTFIDSQNQNKLSDFDQNLKKD